MTDTISATLVKELRERTGAGMMECRKALLETNGDIEKAIIALREKGILKAQTKAGREATEGRIEGFVSSDSNIGALVEVNCETDFVAKTDEFKSLAASLAKQVAKHEITLEQLLDSSYEGDSSKTVSEAVRECIAKLGENIVVRRLVRYQGSFIEIYIHAVGGGKIGTMVELAASDSSAIMNPLFKALAKNLTMQVAAAGSKYVKRQDIPPSVLEEEKRIYRAQAEKEGKPRQVLDKIAEGKLGKFYQTVCLLEQSYIKETDRFVSDIIKETAEQLGTAIEVKRFVRFVLGEKEQ